VNVGDFICPLFVVALWTMLGALWISSALHTLAMQVRRVAEALEKKNSDKKDQP